MDVLFSSCMGWVTNKYKWYVSSKWYFLPTGKLLLSHDDYDYKKTTITNSTTTIGDDDDNSQSSKNEFRVSLQEGLYINYGMKDEGTSSSYN